MFNSEKQQKSNTSHRRLAFFYPRIRLGVFVSLLALCISAFTSPYFALAATTMSSKQNDLTWQAMSHYYYDAVSQCIAQNIVAWNTSEADVKSGKFFRTNWGDGSSMGTAYGFIARDELGDVGDDGKEGCNAKDSELIKKALSHWGLSALEFGCSVLYDRSNGTDCMQGNGGFKVKSEIRTGLFSSMPNSAELSKNFQSYIKGKVFDGKDPTASTKQVQYIYFRQTFLKGCAYNASPLSQKPGGNNVYEIGEVNSSGDVGTVYYVGTESADKNRPIWSNPNREWSCGDIAKRIGPKGDLTTAYSAWYKLFLKNNSSSPPTTEVGSNDSSKDTKSSCSIDGVGWIICPTVLFLADIADMAYVFLADNFLSTSPRLLEQGGPAYTAWQSFLTIGNIFFVIAFIVIIYSQITGYGVSNYGVKRMLPRLIICAIMINLSFILCQVAVDISNILGYSIKNFLAAAPAIDASATSSLEGGRWSAMAITVLAGTGIAAGLSMGIFGLLGILVAAVISLGMIFFILMLRQVFIILLVVIAPIAFAAYLLPNTEQYFTKWRKTLTTLLMVFPIIGIVYGASSLASGIITSVYNDNGPDRTNQLGQIIGAGVLVIPLFAVPVLLKQSLDAVGKIGDRVNAIGSRMGKNAQSKVVNSKMAQFNAEKRARRSAMSAAGVDIMGGGKKNPLNWRSRINKGVVNPILSTAAFGGYGDHRMAQGVDLIKEQEEKEIKDATTLLTSKGITADQMQKIALGENVPVEGINTEDVAIRRAAIRTAMAQNGLGANEQLIAGSGGMNEALRKEVSQGILSNKLGGQANYLGGDMADRVARGEIKNDGDLDIAAASRINGGKFSAESLATQDAKALDRLGKVANSIEDGKFTTSDGQTIDIDAQQLKALQDQAFEVQREDGRLKNTITGEQSRGIESIDHSSYKQP